MTLDAIYASGQSCRTNLYKMKPFRRRRLGHGGLTTLLIFPFLFSLVLGTVPSRNLKYLSEAHFEFSIDLYRQIAAREAGNIVISAQNINLGLAMLFLGTTANTSSSTELRRALHYENMSYVDIHKAHQEILGVLADPYYVDQDFLSKVGLFVQQGVGVKAIYSRAVKEFYQSEIKTVDFGASGSGRVVKAINEWSEEATGGRFPQIMSKEPGSQTRLLVGGAAEMVPRWLYPFDPEQTSYSGQFWLPDGATRLTVPMMTAQLMVPLGYSPTLEARICELPLQARRMSMFLILPDSLNPGIQSMEANMTTETIKALMTTLQDEVVNVKLPRFRIEATRNLEEEIRGLGVDAILTPGVADFTNMVRRNLINLSQFRHRAHIEAKEWGRHGINASNQKQKVGILKQKYFEVDRAFLYFVWDYFTGSILFMGRVTRPLVL